MSTVQNNFLQHKNASKQEKLFTAKQPAHNLAERKELSIVTSQIEIYEDETTHSIAYHIVQQ